MRHPFSVAEVNAWPMALFDAVQSKKITYEVAEFISATSGDKVRELLKGNEVDGVRLIDLTEDDEMIQRTLDKHYYSRARVNHAEEQEPGGYCE